MDWNSRLNAIKPSELPSEELLAQSPVPVQVCLHSQLEQILALTELAQDLIRVVNNNSTNSGIPPSKDPIGFDPKAKQDKQEKGPKKEHSKQAGKEGEEEEKLEEESKSEKKPRPYHPGANRKRLEPNQIFDYKPDCCPHCGHSDLGDCLKPGTPYQQMELPEVPVQVTDHVPYRGTCPHCGKHIPDSVPPEFKTGIGPRLAAFISTLSTQLGATRRRIQAFLNETGLFKSVKGEALNLSQGGIQKAIDRASEASEPYYELIREAAQSAPLAHVDETSWRIFGPLGKIRKWVWCMVSPKVCYLKIQDRRNRACFSELVGDFNGFLITDDYAVYDQYPEDKHQLCLAHLIRHFKKLAEDPDAKNASCGALLLQEAYRLYDMKQNPPTNGQWNGWRLRMGKILKRFEDLMTKAGAQCRRLRKKLRQLYLFLSEEIVEPTNNRAEQTLRSPVILRKISFGSTSEEGERCVERALSLRETCKLNGWSYYQTIVEALHAQARGITPDLSKLEVLVQECRLQSLEMGFVPATP